MTLGPEPGGPIGPPEPLGGVVQLGCRDEQGLRGGEISGAIDDGDPVFGRGKTDPLELAVELGQEVGPGEGGPALGHGPHGHAGRIVEDLVGQVAVVEEGKIISAR